MLAESWLLFAAIPNNHRRNLPVQIDQIINWYALLSLNCREKYLFAFSRAVSTCVLTMIHTPLRSDGFRRFSQGWKVGAPHRRTPSAKLNASKARSFRDACAPTCAPSRPFLRSTSPVKTFHLGASVSWWENTRERLRLPPIWAGIDISCPIYNSYFSE